MTTHSIGPRTTLIPVNLPKGTVQRMDELVAAKLYSSRSDVMRFALRDLLVNHEVWRV